jgi:fatty-acyl-CoA synthase
VEDVLYRHPDVLAAAVVAKPDAKWGETPCAFVELKAGARPRLMTSWRTARSTWPASRCRARWCLASCPRPAPGKIQKFELRKQAGSAAAIDV